MAAARSPVQFRLVPNFAMTYLYPYGSTWSCLVPDKGKTAG